MSQTKAQLISDLVQALNFTGTASAPANGLFLSAANTLQLSTASTPRLTINSDGHVDVVGNLDVGAGVDVTGNIAATGALDIGANAAIFGTLTISNATPTLIFTEDDANPDYKQLAAGGEFVIQNNQGGSYATRFKINADGHIDIAGNVDFAAGIDVTGAITGTADMTIDTNTLHVDSSNNRVGIGITNPATKLNVVDDSGISIEASTNGANGKMTIIGKNNSGQVSAITRIESKPENSSNAATSTLFLNRDSSNTVNTHMTLTSAGKLGIGTTSPSQELTVAGSDPIISVQEASVSSQVDIGTGTSTGFINIQKADGTRTVQINGSSDSYFTGGNIGIGTSSPSVKLDVSSSDSTAWSSSNLSTALRVVNSSTTNGVGAGIQLRTTNGAGAAAVQYIHAVNNSTNYSSDLVFSRRVGTSATYGETCRITNYGNLRFQANRGVEFHNYGTGTGISSNTLDDYEEGTFGIGVTDSNNTFTTGQESGRYIKIGNVVHCTFTINCAISGTSGFAFFLTGFPFTVKNYGSHANEGLGTCKGTGQEIQLEAQQDNTTVKARNPSSGSAMSVNDIGCTNNTVKSVRGYIIYQTT